MAISRAEKHQKQETGAGKFQNVRWIHYVITIITQVAFGAVAAVCSSMQQYAVPSVQQLWLLIDGLWEDTAVCCVHSAPPHRTTLTAHRGAAKKNKNEKLAELTPDPLY